MLNGVKIFVGHHMFNGVKIFDVVEMEIVTVRNNPTSKVYITLCYTMSSFICKLSIEKLYKPYIETHQGKILNISRENGFSHV